VSRLGELTRKVDAFFARVSERHGTDMQCQTGCSDCCHVRLTITGVEAAAIRAHVAGWPRDRRRDLAAGGAEVLPRGTTRCAALDPAGRCKIYDARPLVCRSHGVPIRLRQGALPVVQACHRNFTHTAPDPDCVLDQATLSATLYAVDATEARAVPPGLPRAKEAPGPSPALDPSPSVTGREGAPSRSGAEPGHRVELAGLLADLAAI
jgi:Fe-S-cluster containining protein